MRTLALILAAALLTGVIIPAQAASQSAGLTFHARPIQDTFLIYEPVWVEFEAENTSDTVLPAYPLVLGDPFIAFDVLDTAGGSVTPGGTENDIFTSARDTLTAHGRSSGVARLDYYANVRDSQSQRGYFAPGRYRAIFRWYRPRLALSLETHVYLEDSLVFRVVMPAGEDSLAMEDYKRTFSSNCRARTDALWICYQRHPKSPYADDCLYLIDIVGRDAECNDLSINFDELARRLVIDYPNYPAVGGQVSRLYYASERYCPNRGGRRAMTSILDSIPADSRAAQTARRFKRDGTRW